SIELKPDYAEAWSNRGNALNDLRHHEEALASCERAIELKPDSAEAWINRGVALGDLRRHEEALASYDRSIELKPDSADAYWNKSLHLLRLGDFDQGWQLYEWRWQRDKFTSPSRNFPQPLWLGDASLEGGTILLHSEQGFGDSIQFCRYAKLVKKLGARVVLEIESPLIELFTTLEGVDEIVEKGAVLPNFDYHCPLLSLPLAFKTTVTKIPRDVPYLYSGEAKREQWAQHLSISKDKPSIGIVWSGNPKHKNDHNRSIRLEDMSQAFSDKFHWFSLQKDVPKAEHLLLRSAGVRDHSARLRDFSDTAGLISQLDLVISVDTSVAHLAGALGKPVWVLLPYVPDFRWMWDHEDSAWYPHMRLFRQSSEGDWDTVIARVGQEL
ncbi:MAG: glycosyltransferase family protein, partial [Deltaproteobacteria bacterium]|nr:glycosyltransferase family protein [Deltaproteobacteria bacterium]